LAQLSPTGDPPECITHVARLSWQRPALQARRRWSQFTFKVTGSTLILSLVARSRVGLAPPPTKHPVPRVVPDALGRAREQIPKFGTQDYWEGFYEDNTTGAAEFEWFCSYDMLKPFVDEFIEPLVAASERAGTERLKLIVAGCGNSLLSNEVYDDFVDSTGKPRLDLWNVDYASAAIARVRRSAGSRQMQHVVADLRDLGRDEFPDASADVILDKGTLDALFCAGKASVSAAVGEFRRLLRPGGVAVIVSGVPPASEVVSAFDEWQVMLDGSPYVTDNGDATINLCAHLYVFSNLRP